MSTRKAIADLEEQIDSYYAKHSAKRTALATACVGGFSIGIALGAYILFTNFIVTVSVFGVAGLAGINVAMLWIVPPTERLKQSKEMILGAVKDPTRFKSVEKNRIRLSDCEGRVHTLNALEQTLWNQLVLPYLMRHGLSGGGAGETGKDRFSGRHLTHSELTVLKKERAELIEKEKALQTERSILTSEREELERRTEELKRAENMVIDRLTQVEVTQAEMEQLREDVERSAAARSRSMDPAHLEMLKAKEAELQAKEAELERHKMNLEEDRMYLEAQKTDLNQLKGELVRQHDSVQPLQSEKETELERRERILEERMKELEATAAELEERSAYVNGVENSLIDRLNLLSEREASVEQSEVNAGIRQD